MLGLLGLRISVHLMSRVGIGCLSGATLKACPCTATKDKIAIKLMKTFCDLLTDDKGRLLAPFVKREVGDTHRCATIVQRDSSVEPSMADLRSYSGVLQRQQASKEDYKGEHDSDFSHDPRPQR